MYSNGRTGATITGLQFGWADATQAMETGIIAVGYGVEITGYYCIIDEMYLEGTINSRAFSLDLGSVDSPEGDLPVLVVDDQLLT